MIILCTGIVRSARKRRTQKLLIIGDRSGFPSNFVSARVRLSLGDAADRFGLDPGSANPFQSLSLLGYFESSKRRWESQINVAFWVHQLDEEPDCLGP